jgi:hypothetical protein
VKNKGSVDAVRAHLLELAGDRKGAVSHYRAAAGKTGSLPERNYLLTQAARLSSELQPEHSGRKKETSDGPHRM